MNQRSLNVPVNKNYLPQVRSVQMLLNILHESVLPNITNTEAKNVLVCFSNIFNHERTVCSLSLIDVMKKASELGVSITNEQGVQLLNDAVNDVRDNYASQAIEYHLNLYQEKMERTNAQ